ncbi:unnamed protein product [Rhodiola kirilowii]
MTNLDAPLDFEFDDTFARSPVTTKKRKKLIGLDDLLNDHYKEQSKSAQCKKKKKRKSYSSDEEEEANREAKEAKISEVLNDASSQYEEMKNEENALPWNVAVFGEQGDTSTSFSLNIENLKLTKSFAETGIDFLDPNDFAGDAFFEGLLVNGWLTKMVSICGHVESALTKWVLDLMFYSVKEDVRSAACSFWCDVLLFENKIVVDVMPSYPEFRKALEVYGYLWNSSGNTSCRSESVRDPENCGPPQNIRAWIQLVTACCQVRWLAHPFLVTSEAEELIGTIISMFLDRRLVGLSTLLNDCLVSVISYSSDDNWHQSCERIAKHLSFRVPKDLNCLRLVECIPGANTQSNQKTLKRPFNVRPFNALQITDAEGILNLLISTDVMEENCNLFKIYIYLGLTENWLLNVPALEHDKRNHQLWKEFLKKCSRIGTPSDWRSYASKVKSKVAYLTACIIPG